MTKKITAKFIRELMRDNGLWPKSVTEYAGTFRVSTNSWQGSRRVFEILRANRIGYEDIRSNGGSDGYLAWFRVVPDAVLNTQARAAWAVIGLLCETIGRLDRDGFTQEEAINRGYQAVDFDDVGVVIGYGADTWFVNQNPNIQYARPIGPEANPVVSLEEAADYLYGQYQQAKYELFCVQNNALVRVLALDGQRALVKRGGNFAIVEFPETQTFVVEYREIPEAPQVTYELRWESWGGVRVQAEVYPEAERGSSITAELSVAHYGDYEIRTRINWYSTSGSLETGRKFLAAYQKAVDILANFELLGNPVRDMVREERE